MRPAAASRGAVLFQDGAIAVLDLGGGVVRDQLLHPAVERDFGGRKRRGRIAPLRQRGLQARHRFSALRRHRHRQLGGLVLDRVEPVRVGSGFLQQPVARAQRTLQRRHAAGMFGVDGEHQAVEEAPAFRRRAVEQRIHRRNEPDHPQVVGKRRGGGNRLAIDAALARGRHDVAGRRFDAGSERCETEGALDVARRRPGAVTFGKRQLVERRASQAAPGRQQRDRFDQIGLAGAVRSRQHHERRADVDLRRVIAAEIAQRQAADAGGSHERSCYRKPMEPREPAQKGSVPGRIAQFY